MGQRKRTNKHVPAKGRLRDMADQLWSRAIRADWGWKCAVCNNEKCEAHHLIPRQHQATRYELQNGIALCSSHHQFDADTSPHQNAAGWLHWLDMNWPELLDWYRDITATGAYKTFSGTTNAAYYCDVIRGFREYVEPEEFERIVGIKFSQWLETNS